MRMLTGQVCTVMRLLTRAGVHHDEDVDWTGVHHDDDVD